MATNLDNIQKTAQTLSDNATALQTAADAGTASNTPVTSSTADGTATGSATNVTVAAASTQTAASAYANQSDTVKLVIAHLEDYVQKMDPSKVQTSSSLRENQLMLINTLETLVNTEAYADFAICMRRLLVLAREKATGVFAANMRYRAISGLNKNDAYMKRYVSFLDMICAFAVPSQRAVLIQRYNVTKHSEFAKTENRERLIGFIREISGR